MATYRKLQSAVTDMGGDAGVRGMSGSLTLASMRTVLELLGPDSTSCLLDAGCGCGLPCVVATRETRCSCVGVDFDEADQRKETFEHFRVCFFPRSSNEMTTAPVDGIDLMPGFGVFRLPPADVPRPQDSQSQMVAPSQTNLIPL